MLHTFIADLIHVVHQEAIAQNSFHECPPYTNRIFRGDAAAAFESCDHVVEGETRTGGQEHFYLETHCVRVVPTGEDDEIAVYSGESISSRIQVSIVSCNRTGSAWNLSICRLEK